MHRSPESEKTQELIKKMDREDLYEAKLSGNFYLIKLQDNKEHNNFYLVDKTSLGAGRAVYLGNKINPATGGVSEEPYIIKYYSPQDQIEIDSKANEMIAFRKLQNMDYIVAPHPLDLDGEMGMKQIMLAMPWLGIPIQGFAEIENEKKEKIKSPDHLALDEKVKAHDPINIIKQILQQLNNLHTANNEQKAYLWGDPKGENVVLNVVDGKPIISLIDMGDTRPVTSAQLQEDKNPPMSNWFFVKEKLEGKQGILSDFPPLVAVFAQLLGAEDVLKDKRNIVEAEIAKKNHKVDPQLKEIEVGYNFEGMLKDEKYEPIKEYITSFLNWMQAKDYKDRPSKEVPLFFFTKVEEYLAENNKQKKETLQKILKILSSKVLDEIPKTLIDFLGKNTEESKEIVKLILAAGQNKVLIDNILFAVDALHDGNVTGTSLAFSQASEDNEIKPDEIDKEESQFSLPRSENASVFIEMIAHAKTAEIEKNIQTHLKIYSRNLINSLLLQAPYTDHAQDLFLASAKQYSEAQDQKQKDIFLNKMHILSSPPLELETKALIAITEKKCQSPETDYLTILMQGNKDSQKFATGILDAFKANKLNDQLLKNLIAKHQPSPSSPQSPGFFQRLWERKPTAPTTPKTSDKNKGPS